MAIIRRASQTQGTQALPGVRRTAAATAVSEGAGVAQARGESAGAMREFGGTVARIGADLYERIKAEEKQAADQTALLKASNQIAEWKNRRLFDPKEGAFTLKGEAAQPLPEQLRDEYETLAGGIEEKLTPDQKAAFARIRSNEWQQLDLQVRRHVFDQMQAFKQGELESAITNHVSAAQQSFLDPKMVGLELGKAIDALRANGPALGMGKEELEQKERAIRSETHTGVISNLLAQEKTEAAKIYFEGTKGQIDGKVIDDVTKALEIGTDRKEAQKAFDKILAEGGTWAERRQKARQIEDAEQRDMVENYIDHEEAIDERGKRENYKTTLRGAYDLIDAGKPVIPANILSQLDGDDRRSLQIYAQAKAEGIPIKTNQTTFYRYMQLATNDPAAFIKTNILKDRNNLSDSDLQQLAGLQVSIANGDRVAAGKLLDDYRTPLQVVTQTLTSARIDPNPDEKKNPEQAAAIANLNRMVADRVIALQNSTGKKATNQDIERIVDDILQQQVDTPGSFWKLWQDAGSKRLIEAQVDDIPTDEAERVRNFLKSKGLPTDDATVLGYWIDARARERKK